MCLVHAIKSKEKKKEFSKCKNQKTEYACITSYTRQPIAYFKVTNCPPFFVMHTQNPFTVWADSSDFTNPHCLSARWRIIHLWGKHDCSKDAHTCKYHSKQTSVQVVNITQIIYNNGLWKNICWDSPTKNQGGCSWGGRARHLVIERLGVWFLSVSQSILVQGTEYHIALQCFNQSEY